MHSEVRTKESNEQRMSEREKNLMKERMNK